MLLGQTANSAAQDAEEFCTGTPPDENTEKIKYEIYAGQICNEIRTLWLEKAKASAYKSARSTHEEKKDEARENINADIDLIKKISDSVKTTEKELPKLDAFTSTSKRYISDLGYKSGLETGKDIQSKLTLGKTIILKNAEEADLWLNQTSAKETLDKLAEIDFDADSVRKSPQCTPQKKKGEVTFKSGVIEIAAAVSAAKALLDGISALSYNFQPQVSSATSVEAPTAVRSSIISGFQTGYNLSAISNGKPPTDFYSRPPLISSSNMVVVAANKASVTLSQAVASVESMSKKLKAGEAFPPSCIEPITQKLSGATKAFQTLNVKNLTPESGSIIDQAARQQAILDMKIQNFVLLDVIVSGGAVTGYQRNRFSSVKLISTGDISLVTQAYITDGTIAASTYTSLGCGSAIPLGEFSTAYKSSSCAN